MQVSSDVAWATAHVAGRTYVPHTRAKSVQKLPVKWFVLELIEDAPDVFVGHGVVARFDVAALWIMTRHFQSVDADEFSAGGAGGRIERDEVDAGRLDTTPVVAPVPTHSMRAGRERGSE